MIIRARQQTGAHGFTMAMMFSGFNAEAITTAPDMNVVAAIDHTTGRIASHPGKDFAW
jgi:hypothetical protein